MPIIGTMEIVVVAAGLLVLLGVPAVFGFIDERRARAAAAVVAPAAALGTAEGAIDQAAFASPAAADVPDDGAPPGGDPGAEAVGVPLGPHDPADT